MARHHVAIQMEKEQQWQKDNGPIVMTVDELFKYSGKIEEESEDYKNYLKFKFKRNCYDFYRSNNRMNIKAANQKEYMKKYNKKKKQL